MSAKILQLRADAQSAEDAGAEAVRGLYRQMRDQAGDGEATKFALGAMSAAIGLVYATIGSAVTRGVILRMIAGLKRDNGTAADRDAGTWPRRH